MNDANRAAPMAIRTVLLILTTGFAIAPPPGASAQPMPLTPRMEESALAVVTLRAGPAARLAHDHLVISTEWEGEIRFDPNRPANTTFTATVPVDRLQVDEPGSGERWGARIVEVGILDGPPGTPSEGDRRKIREEMLGQGQLDVENHARIGVRLVGLASREAVEAAPGENDLMPSAADFPWVAEVELTVRGVAVVGSAAARYRWNEGVLTVEAVGSHLFRDFGISPYSAFLGTIRVADRFHLYLHLVADITGDR